MIIKKIYRHVRDHLFFSRQELNAKRKKDEPAIILMGSPEYNNLGDHGIAYATKLFVKKRFPDKEFIEITENEIRYNLKRVKKIVTKEDLLLLQGGGNLGDLYPDQERVRDKIFKNFSANKIILMPQTIEVSNPVSFFEKLNKQSERLIILAREEVSYKTIKAHYLGEVFLMPDIVVSLAGKIEDGKVNNKVRKGIKLCFRNDIEEADTTKKLQEEIKSLLDKKELSYEKISMIADKSISVAEREEALKKQLELFTGSGLVITDRLHGMIFSYITGTDCIVLPTKNHKVTSSYEWLKGCERIKLCTDIKEIEKCIEALERDSQ